MDILGSIDAPPYAPYGAGGKSNSNEPTLACEMEPINKNYFAALNVGTHWYKQAKAYSTQNACGMCAMITYKNACAVVPIGMGMIWYGMECYAMLTYTYLLVAYLYCFAIVLFVYYYPLHIPF